MGAPEGLHIDALSAWNLVYSVLGDREINLVSFTLSFILYLFLLLLVNFLQLSLLRDLIPRFIIELE